jgi:hypothetical protein
MGKQPTEKSRYPSKYSPGGWVTGMQYIIETVCERKATAKKIDLPIKFWNRPEWEKFYKSQLRKCRSLIKTYGEKAVLAGVKSKEIWNLWSLFHPKLESVIIKEAQRLEAEKNIVPAPTKEIAENPLNTAATKPKTFKGFE